MEDISTHTPLAGRDRKYSRVYVHKYTISTHTPLAGRDAVRSYNAMFAEISTHTPLAGRDNVDNTLKCDIFISTHTPLAGRDRFRSGSSENVQISTHTPLAGRDESIRQVIPRFDDFYSHAPRGARLSSAMICHMSQ